MYSKQYWSKIWRCPQGISRRWLLCINLQVTFEVKQGCFRQPSSSKYFYKDLLSVSLKKITTCTPIFFMNPACSTKLTDSTGLLESQQKKTKGKRNKIYYRTCWNSNDLTDSLPSCSRQNKMRLNALRKAKTKLQK